MSTILNKVFRSVEGVEFQRADAKEVTNVGNFIANFDGQIKCFVAGHEVAVPEILINEVGVKYRYIASEKALYDYAKKLARVNGVKICKKMQEARIRVWFDVEVGQQVESNLNGFTEANGKVMEGGVVVQNLKGGEKWPQTREYLEANYFFVESCEDGTAIYESKGKPTKWVYCEENIFYPKWGGIDFYATPMIKLDEEDPYGCNYARFWGDDSTVGTYVEVGIFTSCGQKFYDNVRAIPVGIKDAKFNPPEELLEQEVA